VSGPAGPHAKPAPANEARRAHARLRSAQLPSRLERLLRSGERMREAGWDINLLALLACDAGRLADTCRELEAQALADDLATLASAAGALVEAPRLPDRAAASQLTTLLARIARCPLPADTRPASPAVTPVVDMPTHENGYPLLTIAPTGHAERLARFGIGHADAPEAAERQQRPEAPVSAASPLAMLHAAADAALTRVETGTRPGGLLLLVPADDASATPLERSAALRARFEDWFRAQLGNGERLAETSPGRWLVLGPERDPEQIASWALNLRDRIEREPFDDAGTPHVLRFDVGAVTLDAGAGDAVALADAARKVVDGGRAAGRHGVFVARDVSTIVDAALIREIRGALESGQGFELAFQPIMGLHAEASPQFQALLRMRDPAKRLRPAAHVIPAAEQAGLLERIDRWVLTRCAQILAEPRESPPPRLFASQSLASIRQDGIGDLLHTLLAQHAIEPDRIAIEIRIADAQADLDAARRYAAAVQGQDVPLSLAGFGAATDTRMLDALSPSFVKLDAMLLAEPGRDARDALRVLVDGLHERGIQVIAPRVEDANAAAMLWASGTDYIQGNFVQPAESGLSFEFGSAEI